MPVEQETVAFSQFYFGCSSEEKDEKNYLRDNSIIFRCCVMEKNGWQKKNHWTT